uniref:Uncharacterized protein n=1 Tax=Oreochromis niloticus TaxID=8128 RepID=A0A669DCH0_ORENI
MDAWTDGWADGWMMDGWMDAWTDGWADGWMDGSSLCLSHSHDSETVSWESSVQAGNLRLHHPSNLLTDLVYAPPPAPPSSSTLL